MDTIFALSSGAPPAAIGIIRISGPQAGRVLTALAGRLPAPRQASLAKLKDESGALLDEALMLWFPGPASATGEDCAELHCHGGRAVVAAVKVAIERMPDMREAEPGEFTRRAFVNGRIDLAEAEGLADLLAAETELQRRVAASAASGLLSRKFEDWRTRILALSASVESTLDFSDEDDVEVLPAGLRTGMEDLAHEMETFANAPTADRLREGIRIVLAGPPNAGKSTLFNAIVQSEAAIVSPIAGTTRDIIERPVALSGVPFVFVDTAGLRDRTHDSIEEVGIARAKSALENADIVLWLGKEGAGPEGAWEIETRIDQDGSERKGEPRHRVSGTTGAGVEKLIGDIVATARTVLPKPGEAAINDRQAILIRRAAAALRQNDQGNPLLIAENLRVSRGTIDQILGSTATEDMLDTLFGRFCIGK